MSRAIGFKAEDDVLAFLKKKGLTLLAKNFQSKFGEIDLIMQDMGAVVFIEVRKRISATHGNSVGTVTYSKQKKLIKTANYYLLKSKIKYTLPTRFDIIGLDGEPPKITWVKNAFGVN